MLDDVESSKRSAVYRTDVFMDAVNTNDFSIVVGFEGVVITAVSGTDQWERYVIADKPTLIDIVECANGTLASLSMEGQVWISDDKAQTWSAHDLSTTEIPQAITCDPNSSIWVIGSYSTILSSPDGGDSWVDHSINEDIILSTIQFLNDKKGIITGEFGTVLITEDGGQTWDFSEPIPKEFLPLAAYFHDEQQGWVAGLNGIIYSTKDGASSWQKETTNTKAPLFGISVKDDEVIVVGDYGTIIHKNFKDNTVDNSWTTLEVPIKSRFFFRVSYPIEGNKLIIAGGAGSLDLIDI